MTKTSKNTDLFMIFALGSLLVCILSLIVGLFFYLSKLDQKAYELNLLSTHQSFVKLTDDFHKLNFDDYPDANVLVYYYAVPSADKNFIFNTIERLDLKDFVKQNNLFVNNELSYQNYRLLERKISDLTQPVINKIVSQENNVIPDRINNL